MSKWICRWVDLSICQWRS